jgi:hypothetical protein
MTMPKLRYIADNGALGNGKVINWYYVLMVAGFVACMLQIWVPAYFLNCDGPCHLANAKAMLAMWTVPGEDFYSRFYTISDQPNPNWLTNILLVALLPIVKGAVAEKILISGYVLLMLVSLNQLLRKLSGGRHLFTALFLVFIFNNTLAQGFYNFSFSISFFLLLVNSWLGYLEHNRNLSAVWIFAFMLLTYFSHPVSFGYGIVVCFSLLLSYAASGYFSGDAKRITKYAMVLILCALPFLLFFLTFAENSAKHGKIVPAFMPERLTELMSFDYLVNYSSKEVLVVKLLGVIFTVLFFLVFVFKLVTKRYIHKLDGLLLSLLIVVYAFLNMPDKMMGGGLFVMRTGLYLFLITGFCAAYLLSNKVKNIFGIIGFLCFLLLVTIRIPIMYAGAQIVKEHATVSRLMPEGSVLLPLNFNKMGKGKDGNILADRNEVYGHVAQYIGADNEILVLDNYEANTGYFPLNWKNEVNPYIHLNRYRGIEGKPPGGGPVQYKQKTGVNIDYILLLNYEPSFAAHVDFIELKTQLDTAFHEIYRSKSEKTVLLMSNSK